MTDRPEPETESFLPAPPPAVDGDAELIEDRAGLERWAERVAAAPRIAIDTEANSLFAYREQTCVLQLSDAHGHAILDVLALGTLEPLARAFDRPELEVVVHGGDYDVTVLTRDFDFSFHRMFDTMIAATMLGLPKLGLAALVADAYGVTLDKRFQKADWGKRPLSAEQLVYLQRDTQYLLGLRDVLGGLLADKDLAEETEIEFRRLATRRGEAAQFDEHSWRRVKGADKLSPAGQTILQELHDWRESEAKRRDTPPFKVVAPQLLHVLARRPPKPGGSLKVLPPRIRSRYGKAILEAIARGQERAGKGDYPPPKPKPKRRSDYRDIKKATEAVKNWRKGVAAGREVPNAVVLPNPAVEWLAVERPTSLDQLSACDDIGPKRVERYGEAILAALAATSKDSD